MMSSTRTLSRTLCIMFVAGATLPLVACAQNDRSARLGNQPIGVAPAGLPQPAKPTTAGATDVVAIPQLRERAAAILLEFAEKGEPEQKANALEALLPMPARLEQVARPALRSSNPAVRGVAAMAVGRAKLTRLADDLRPLLTDESQAVRGAAIYGLSRAGARIDPSPLAGMLADDQVGVRTQAAFILGELGNASAVPMLLEASAAPAARADAIRDRLMRLQIAEALVKLKKEDAIHEIRAALYPARPEDLEACALAVQILGQVKDQGSKSQLRNLLRDNYDSGSPMPIEVRLAAAMSLARMGESQYASIGLNYAASAMPAQRAQAALLLGESGEATYLAQLSGMLGDPDPLVRIAASAGVLKITENAGRGRQ